MSAETTTNAPSSSTPDTDNECPICQETFKDPITTDPCKHTYCKRCLRQWLEVTVNGRIRTCPLCRGSVEGFKEGAKHYRASNYTKESLEYLAEQHHVMTERIQRTIDHHREILLARAAERAAASGVVVEPMDTDEDEDTDTDMDEDDSTTDEESEESDESEDESESESESDEE
ncbi:RING/U-box [Glarea lozoyensis ATCC 20868]|uniref:RING/U-box n=2 Tax=Glarea lozoyensis TaxID=101852 RepID=S3DDT3_GLAL2|nr:RING/U-box [Glarea lozoyensis ATCC 20868]EHK99290.1 putative E3 ubiquitin-protein ligase [Glarea lozoyensis 74030]EPE36592.1 RING/U-box [Glarea lozoyensis ATCC 20868]